MEFLIRKIQKKDEKDIVRIDGIHSGKRKPKYWKERLKAFFKKSPDGFTCGFVAEDGSKVIGYVLAEARAWEFGSALCGWIFAIGVDPKHARKGVAMALCEEVCKNFKRQDIHHVRTMTRKDDVPLLSFFRSAGFHAGPFVELELEL
jgi:ribosomal protein S18 acetylase RimI-like enzyme